MDSSRKFIIVAIGSAILLIILVSCTLAYAGRDNTLMSDKSVHLMVNGFTVELPLAKDRAIYDAVSLSSVTPNRIKLMNDLGANVKINNKGIGTGNTIELECERLSAMDLIEIKVSNEKDERTLYLRTLSSQIPQMSIAGESPNEGNYYGSFVETPGIFQLNEKGELVFYIARSPKEFAGLSYWDFKKHRLENGSVRYSYQRAHSNVDEIELFGYGPGERVILDENYQEIKTIALKESDYSRMKEPIEGHDFILIDDNHYLVSAYQQVLINNIPSELNPNPMGTKVVRTLIQEVKDDAVIFEFVSDDYPELYALSVEENDYTNTQSQASDYAHFNSMVIDPKDENLIVSFRNLNTIMKIDRSSGKILWKLSGNGDEFGLTPEQKTSRQHDVKITEDGYLTVFDNGNDSKNTRILKLKLDETNKKLLEYKEYKVLGNTSLACGSVQKDATKEIYTIGWGMNTALTAMTEVDFSSGKKLFEMTLPEGISTYRIQKFK